MWHSYWLQCWGGSSQVQTPLQPQGMSRNQYMMAPPTPRSGVPSTPWTPLVVPQVPMPRPMTPSNQNLREFAFGMSPLFQPSPQHQLDPLMELVAPIPDSTRSTNTQRLWIPRVPAPNWTKRIRNKPDQCDVMSPRKQEKKNRK